LAVSVVGLVSRRKLERYLALNHPERRAELKRNAWMNGRRVERYVWNSRDMDDPRIRELKKRTRRWNILTWIAFPLLLLSALFQ
jgi:hypothetical protein